MSDQESAPVENESQVKFLELEEVKKLSIHEKIVKVMEHVKYVQKNSNVSTGGDKSYKAVTHDDVTGKLHDVVAAYGLTIVPEMISCEIHEMITEKKYANNPVPDIKRSYRADVWIEVEFANAHNPDQRFKKKWFAYAMDSMDKATGKAVSMAFKFCLLKTFMLETGENEESRDFENSQNFNPNDRRHDRYNNQNRNGNQPNRNATNNGSNNKGNENANRNNTSNGTNNNGNNQASQNSKGQESSKTGAQESSQEASENQIKAIAKICETKKIEVGEKFKSTKTCSSKEAGEEIKRLSAIKA